MRIVIVGAGIIGLATAYELINRYPKYKVSLIEKEEDVGLHQSGRNSGVIHSGIYYPPGSQKSISCKKGYSQLINFCNTYDVNYEICGKLIVATENNELQYLEILKNRGLLQDLQIQDLKSEEVSEIEPKVKCIRALYVPEAGIINYQMVMSKIKKILISHGVKFYFNSKLQNIFFKKNLVIIEHSNGHIGAEYLINSAGLHSDTVARMCELKIDEQVIPFRGEYFDLIESKNKLVNRLVYPVPNPQFPFLGVHVTKTINGNIHCGPNAVLALAKEGYSWRIINKNELFDILKYSGFWKLALNHWGVGMHEVYRSFNKKEFVRSLQKMIPSIQESDLVTAKSGVRAQVVRRDGSLVDDFKWIQRHQQLHILNAPSPAATSCFAIAEQIVNLIPA